MTPKEKAKQLYEKSEDFIYTSQAHFAEDDCEKNCANIAVYEILEIIRYHGTDIGKHSLKYWLDVKHELSLL